MAWLVTTYLRLCQFCGVGGTIPKSSRRSDVGVVVTRQDAPLIVQQVTKNFPLGDHLPVGLVGSNPVRKQSQQDDNLFSSRSIRRAEAGFTALNLPKCPACRSGAVETRLSLSGGRGERPGSLLGRFSRLRNELKRIK